MREPKRLAHRQAERNKARAIKQWSWDDEQDEPELTYTLSKGVSMLDGEEALSTAPAGSYQL